MNRSSTYIFIISLSFICSPAQAQTSDDLTPAEETACDSESGAAYGLCNAYCEAMDCDSDNTQASAMACQRVSDMFAELTGRNIPCQVPAVSQCPCFNTELCTEMGGGDCAFINLTNIASLFEGEECRNSDSCLNDGNDNAEWDSSDFCRDIEEEGESYGREIRVRVDTTPSAGRCYVEYDRDCFNCRYIVQFDLDDETAQLCMVELKAYDQWYGEGVKNPCGLSN